MAGITMKPFQARNDIFCIRNDAEDTVLNCNHVDGSRMGKSIAARAGIMDKTALGVSVVRLAQCSVDANIRRAPSEKKMGDAFDAQHLVQIGISEGTVGCLVDYNVALQDRDVRHNVKTRRRSKQNLTAVETRAPTPPALIRAHI